MRPIRLLPWFALPVLAHAQSSQATAPAFTASGAFIALSVADLDASVRWYSEKLGLRVVQRPPKFDQSTAVILEGGGLIVELVHRDDARSLATVAPDVKANYLVHGIFKGGIIVDDFDKTLSLLKARGVEVAIGPFPARGDQPANVIVRDNGGNLIQFFGPR
jgi:catechol 2,3-dioxygenase-like lactoylglutathione lyase family enzyme